MEDITYQAVKKLLQSHVAKWKGVKSQEDGLGYVLSRIEEFVDDSDEAYTYVGDD